jgi:hypothetical protein
MPLVGRLEIKVVGKRGQLSLGRRYAGKILRIERRRNGSLVLTEVQTVPQSQYWTLTRPASSRISRGLAWAKQTEPAETDLDALVRHAASARRRVR